MGLVFGMIAIASGIAASAAAGWFPAQRSRLEGWGSSLFLGGLAVLGLSSPLI